MSWRWPWALSALWLRRRPAQLPPAADAATPPSRATWWLTGLGAVRRSAADPLRTRLVDRYLSHAPRRLGRLGDLEPAGALPVLGRRLAQRLLDRDRLEPPRLSPAPAVVGGARLLLVRRARVGRPGRDRAPLPPGHPGSLAALVLCPLQGHGIAALVAAVLSLGVAYWSLDTHPVRRRAAGVPLPRRQRTAPAGAVAPWQRLDVAPRRAADRRDGVDKERGLGDAGGAGRQRAGGGYWTPRALRPGPVRWLASASDCCPCWLSP